MTSILLADFYKISHYFMYPKGMTKLYSNWIPRKSRLSAVTGVVVAGNQWFFRKYLQEHFNEHFFNTDWAVIEEEYKYVNGPDAKMEHVRALYDLGYLPIEIKALEEGTVCPIGVPCLTITNTHADFAWLVNYLETLISCCLWQTYTSATIAREYKKLLTKWALKTTGKADGVQWQAHDFSMRGMEGIEGPTMSGMGHLMSFTGTDTIPAILELRKYYGSKGLIGASVPATEHSVMSMGTKEEEIETFKFLLATFATGILSVVSDTWDLWKVLTVYLPQLKDIILSRDGKLVIRPDSGDPVKIITGYTIGKAYGEGVDDWFSYECVQYPDGKYYLVEPTNENRLGWKAGKELSEPEVKGVIQLLYEAIGGTINELGYIELDSHIGAIYGDSITLDRAEAICERLAAKGYASTNIVFGIGSYTYQYNTRDTFGFAMKATYGEITTIEADVTFGAQPVIEAREIFKDPVTDDGTKKSKRGLVRVDYDENGNIVCFDRQTKYQEAEGLLKTVFLNGKVVKPITLDEIREKLTV